MSNREPVHLACPFGVAFLMALSALWTGCSSHDKQPSIEQHIAAPATTPTSSEFCDLGVDANLFKNDTPTRVLAGDQPALLPAAAIAVARVHCDGGATGRSLQIETIAPERAAFWNQLVGDLAGVREMVVLRTLGMDPRGVTHKEILQAARGQECNYCLIFQIDDFVHTTAQVRAVLWNVDDGAALVTFNSHVTLPDSVVALCSEDEDMAFHREADASYQVEAELRKLVRDTLWDMAAKTTPADGPTSRPNPWKTDQPILPRDDYRYRRYFMQGGA